MQKYLSWNMNHCISTYFVFWRTCKIHYKKFSLISNCKWFHYMNLFSDSAFFYIFLQRKFHAVNTFMTYSIPTTRLCHNRWGGQHHQTHTTIAFLVKNYAWKHNKSIRNGVLYQKTISVLIFSVALLHLNLIYKISEKLQEKTLNVSA